MRDEYMNRIMKKEDGNFTTDSNKTNREDC